MSNIVNCGNRYLLLKDNKIKHEDITDKFIDEYISWCRLSNELCKKMTSKGVSKEDYKDAYTIFRIKPEELQNILKSIESKLNQKDKFGISDFLNRA